MCIIIFIICRIFLFSCLRMEFRLRHAAPGNATEQLMAQGAFKIRSGQVGTPMIQNGGVQSDPNRECTTHIFTYFYYIYITQAYMLILNVTAAMYSFSFAAVSRPKALGVCVFMYYDTFFTCLYIV